MSDGRGGLFRAVQCLRGGEGAGSRRPGKVTKLQETPLRSRVPPEPEGVMPVSTGLGKKKNL